MNEHDLDALAQSQEHATAIRGAVEHLHALFAAYETPAVVETVALTAAQPTQRLEAGFPSRSIGIYNPSPSIVYMGDSGGKPSEAARAWSVPPSSALVLPVMAEDLEFGAETDVLATGDVVFKVLRFTCVQPFFFGGL